MTQAGALMFVFYFDKVPTLAMLELMCVVCVCVCVRVCAHVFVTNEDINLYNDMGMTGITRRR